jgi:hypothetical protein
MKNTCLFCLLLLFGARSACGAPQVGADSILSILKQKNGPQKEKRLILSLRYFFGGRPEATLPAAKRQLDNLLTAYPVPDAKAVGLLGETMYRMELKQYVAAEKALVTAVGLADREDDHYLLYACFTQLSFLQSLKGHMTEAVASFRQARKEAITLNDAYLQVLVDINISDIYHRNKLYGQSLAYLDQAQQLMRRQQLQEPNFIMMILVNKGENYFSMGKPDSLAKYSRLLQELKVSSPRLYTFRQRSIYTLQLLREEYLPALARLAALRNDPQYAYEQSDEQNLVNALYQTRQLDSARVVARRLIADPSLQNHPEVTLPLYEMLARIAVARSEKDLGIHRFAEALQQAKTQLTRLVEVDTIAARLKLDEMENSYVRREEGFKRERLWLIFSTTIIGLVCIVAAMLYRNIRQKRHFEKLLYDNRRDELSFINSHEVRRHLSNILGIIETISHSGDKHQGYLEAEAHLLKAAEDLDSSIRHIAERLSD